MTTPSARPPIEVHLCDKEIEDAIKSLLTEYRELDEMTKEVQFPHHCFNCIIQAKKSMRFAIDNLEMATLALEKFERRQENFARNTRGQSV